jgi:SpoVK/Ycf46/Vps4 family AAA+-type ATPase
VAQLKDIEKEFVHVARLNAETRYSDAAMLFRRTLPELAERRPDLAARISDVLNNLAGSLVRSQGEALPIDLDSRLELLKRDPEPLLNIEPVWPDSVGTVLKEIIHERSLDTELRKQGIEPTKSLLFTGAPGTGKSLAAKWLARELKFPLLTLDLSAVMSSFLGRTGNNIRVVLDYARKSNSILLLDEFDAIAKRRDDAGEIGELKRLVTVLLQEIDTWPSENLLIAATNHPDLLDPAVWRRFDRVMEFPLPSQTEISKLIEGLIEPYHVEVLSSSAIAGFMTGCSFADITRMITLAKRSSIVRNVDFNEVLVSTILDSPNSKSTKQKLILAQMLKDHGQSQRQISVLTGLSRDTLRSRLNYKNGFEEQDKCQEKTIS